jgi:hypothetical protein
MQTYKELLEKKGDPVTDLKSAWIKANRNNKIADFDDWVEAMIGELEDAGVKGPNKAYTYLFGTAFKYGTANPAQLAMAFANYMKKVK